MFSRTIFLFLDFGKFFSRVIYLRFKKEKLFKPANLRKNSEFKIVNSKQKATKQGLDHRFVALTRFICRIFVSLVVFAIALYRSRKCDRLYLFRNNMVCIRLSECLL